MMFGGYFCCLKQGQAKGVSRDSVHLLLDMWVHLLSGTLFVLKTWMRPSIQEVFLTANPSRIPSEPQGLGLSAAFAIAALAAGGSDGGSSQCCGRCG